MTLRTFNFHAGTPIPCAILAELTQLYFPITKRMEFAKYLGVPSKEVHTIELTQASDLML